MNVVTRDCRRESFDLSSSRSSDTAVSWFSFSSIRFLICCRWYW